MISLVLSIIQHDFFWLTIPNPLHNNILQVFPFISNRNIHHHFIHQDLNHDANHCSNHPIKQNMMSYLDHLLTISIDCPLYCITCCSVLTIALSWLTPSGLFYFYHYYYYIKPFEHLFEHNFQKQCIVWAMKYEPLWTMEPYTGHCSIPMIYTPYHHIVLI